MLAVLLRTSRFVGRKLLITAVLGFIGLLVGFGCVLLPMGIPIGIVAIAGLVLLWALPDLQTVPARFTTGMFYVFIVSVLCIPTYYAIVLPGLPWLSFRRTILFAWLIPLVITIAASSTYRSHMVETMRACRPLMHLFVALCGCYILSSIMSGRLLESIGVLVNIVMTWLMPMFCTVMLIREERQVEFILKLLLVCVAIDVGFGAVEFYLGRPYLFASLPAETRSAILSANPAYAALLLGQGIRNGLYRAFSIFNTALSWGEMAAIMGPIALYFLAHGRSLNQRVLGVVGFGLCLLSIILSGSRGAYVALLGSIVFSTVTWAVRQYRVNPKSLAGGMAVFFCCVGSVAMLFMVYFVPRLHNMVLGGGDAQSSTDARWAEWDMAKPKIALSPIWGYGPNTAGDVVGYTSGGDIPSIDSYLISVLVELGIVGFIVFYGMFLYAIYAGARSYLTREDRLSEVAGFVASSLVAFLVYRITLSQQENITAAFLMVGLMFSLHYCIAQEDARAAAQRAGMAWPPRRPDYTPFPRPTRQRDLAGARVLGARR